MPRHHVLDRAAEEQAGSIRPSRAKATGYQFLTPMEETDTGSNSGEHGRVTKEVERVVSVHRGWTKICGEKKALRNPSFNGPQGLILKNLVRAYPKLRLTNFDTYMKPIMKNVLLRKMTSYDDLLDEWENEDFIKYAKECEEDCWPKYRPDAWCFRHKTIHWIEVEATHFMSKGKLFDLYQLSDGEFYDAYGVGFQVWLVDRYGKMSPLDEEDFISFPFEASK